MPVPLTYPGVYIEELPSGVRTITGVATSITAFVGRARRGPANQPVRITNLGAFERTFGGLWEKSSMSYAVQQYFLNGGSDALIVRVHKGAAPSSLELKAGSASVLSLEAASLGSWGGQLQARVNHNTRQIETGESAIFNLSIKDFGTGTEEDFFNISLDPAHPRYVATVLAQGSNLIRVKEPLPAGTPTGGPFKIPDEIATYEDSNEARIPSGEFAKGADGADRGSSDKNLNQNDLKGKLADKTGIYALENADLFNILCIPALSLISAETKSTWDAAAKYCKDRRALLLVDPQPAWNSVSSVTAASTGVDSLITRTANSAVFFPSLVMADPLKENRLREFPPCGAVAGLIARTDAQRGVWKAPAGMEATLRGVSGLSVKLTDSENGQLNPLGINCLRAFPVIGQVVWGARTLRGADMLADQWKYLPVRRLALMIEESLFRGTQWVVFEPNDEPLWAQIRLNIGAFMQNLFRQGAFQGTSPREAYFVKCDRETTTQDDINRGIVNIVVGFAPLKPAEFVVVKIQQIAGDVAA